MCCQRRRRRRRNQPFLCSVCCIFCCYGMRLIKHDWMLCYFISRVRLFFVCAIFNQKLFCLFSWFNMKCDPNAIIHLKSIKKIFCSCCCQRCCGHCYRHRTDVVICFGKWHVCQLLLLIVMSCIYCCIWFRLSVILKKTWLFSSFLILPLVKITNNIDRKIKIANFFILSLALHHIYLFIYLLLMESVLVQLINRTFVCELSWLTSCEVILYV